MEGFWGYAGNYNDKSLGIAFELIKTRLIIIVTFCYYYYDLVARNLRQVLFAVKL